MERPSRMFGEPGRHLRMFMGGIVVEDGVDHLAGQDGPLDGCDEADKLLMPMARHAAADDLAFEHAERGEQGRVAVAFIIVRGSCAFPPPQRKTRLGPVERLGSGFSRRWSSTAAWREFVIETDDIIKLGGEVGIVGSLEGPDPMRLKLMGGPYALDRSPAKDPIALAMARRSRMGDLHRAVRAGCARPRHAPYSAALAKDAGRSGSCRATDPQCLPRRSAAASVTPSAG